MYSCHSVFMVRTPALPMEVAEKMYGCDYRDIWKYIRDMSLDGYFTESLKIASPSLYEAIKKLGGGGDEKRDRATCLSLYKYLIRAATRTTPYGIFAGVALAEFGSRGVHSVDSGRIHKKISADNLWLYKLIEKIEKNQAALEKLSLIWNKSCYVSGRRMRNPIYSKHGTSENAIKENSSIRYSPLVELVVSSAQDYINYRELVGIIKSAYDYVPDEKVINVINTLIEQEYLLTEIRIPAYCSNTLSYCLGVLERRNILPELREQLNQIQRRFDEYEEGYGQGVEIPLTQVIDPAGFDGLSYMDVTRSEENEREELKKYNSIYAECGSDEYLLTEIREMPTAGRLSNVMNWSNNYPCCFLLGMMDTENKSRRIFLDDIKIIEWLSYLFDENYIYTLEIEIEVIVVLTEAWRLTKKHFRIQNLD